MSGYKHISFDGCYWKKNQISVAVIYIYIYIYIYITIYIYIYITDYGYSSQIVVQSGIRMKENNLRTNLRLKSLISINYSYPQLSNKQSSCNHVNFHLLKMANSEFNQNFWNVQTVSNLTQRYCSWRLQLTTDCRMQYPTRHFASISTTEIKQNIKYLTIHECQTLITCMS